MGLGTNLANPKAGVFALSFLPQFVPAGEPVFAMLVLLALLSTLIDLMWYLVIVVLANAARRFFRKRRAPRRMEQVSGVALIGLGLRLGLEVH